MSQPAFEMINGILDIWKIAIQAVMFLALWAATFRGKKGKRDGIAAVLFTLANIGIGFLPYTVASIMKTLMEEGSVSPDFAIMKHEEGIYFVPANIELSSVEVALVNTMGRESILKEYISIVSPYFDYILLDTMPSLGMLTINALAAAGSVLVPCQAQYLSLNGLEQLIVTIMRVRQKLNPELDFEGILLTMADARTNFSKEIMEMVRSNYGSRIPVFEEHIPLSVRAAETAAEGKSIFVHDPKGRVAAAYSRLTDEVLANA